MGKRTSPIIAPCSICGTAFTLKVSQRAYWRATGRAICSPPCLQEARNRAALKSGVATEAGRASISRHMKARNPMSDPRVRAKVATTLRSIGHAPKERGGNGRGLTEPQRLLAEALGWETEVIVKTGSPTRGPAHVPGIPVHYKLDIASPELMIAVEVDGGSHCALERKAQDQRKDEWLTGAGWTVLRFSNREVMADTGACARMVMSTTSKSPGRTPTSLPAA